MWCVTELTPEYIARMEDILKLYAKPYNPNEPVICLDEKSKQLIEDTRPSRPMKEWKPKRVDAEYKRKGTKNIFVSVEPKAGHRKVTVTQKRTKRDFAEEIESIMSQSRYKSAKRVHIVLDNLNTHFASSLYERFKKEKADRILSRIKFHYTPKHGSWLNMAEIEIGILSRQCIKGRIPTEEKLVQQTRAWTRSRNKEKKKIAWDFRVKNAREKFKY